MVHVLQLFTARYEINVFSSAEIRSDTLAKNENSAIRSL